MKKYSTHIIWAIVVVIALVGGWYYGKSTAASGSAGGRASAFARSSSTFARAGAGATGGFASGVVTAKDAQSITLQLPNGNSEVVFYSSSTSVIEPTPASINNVAVGASVSVGGTTNSDGSVTASTIQVRGANMPGPGGAGGFGGAGNGGSAGGATSGSGQ